jgi:hypothetical protein
VHRRAKSRAMAAVAVRLVTIALGLAAATGSAAARPRGVHLLVLSAIGSFTVATSLTSPTITGQPKRDWEDARNLGVDLWASGGGAVASTASREPSSVAISRKRVTGSMCCLRLPPRQTNSNRARDVAPPTDSLYVLGAPIARNPHHAGLRRIYGDGRGRPRRHSCPPVLEHRRLSETRPA